MMSRMDRAAKIAGPQRLTIARARDAIKERNRKKKAYDQWSKEYIRIQLFDEVGEEVLGCTWKVQRRKLTLGYLQHLLDQSPIKHTKVDCLRDAKTQEVIWPEEMQVQCQPQTKSSYILMPRWPNFPTDQAVDPHYEGDYGMRLSEVPLRTSNDRFEVNEKDVRAWLVFAILEEDRKSKQILGKIADIEGEMKVTLQAMKEVPHLNMDRLSADEADRERERLYKEYENERNAEGEELDLIKKRLRIHRLKRATIHLELERVEVDEAGGVCSWTIRFIDPDGPEIMTDLLKKFDWNGIRLCVGYDGNPSWAGRDKVPDGTKKHAVDYSYFVVTTRGIKIGRLFHGYGTYKCTALKGIPITSPTTSFYHGKFKAGRPEGLGLSYSEEGIFFGMHQKGIRNGMHQKGLRNGKGRLDAANGDIIEANFGYKFISAYDETFEGEWKDGQLHGYGTWKGQTKEEYKGSFHLGHKWGRGVERYRGSNFYKGFFREDYRTGRGTLCYGHVQEKPPRAAGLPKEIIYDCRMDCDWLAGYMRSGGVNYYMKSNTSFYTFNQESLWYPYVSQLKERQDARLRSTNRLRKRHSFMLNHVRESLEKAKRDAFKHCLRLAGLFIKKEAVQGKGGLAQQMRREVDRVMDERQGYYEHAVRHGYIEKDDEQVLANLELPKKVKELERVARKEGYELRVGTEEEKEEEVGEGGGEGPSVLSALLQLVFEEAEERWRVFGSARCMKIWMRQAELEADKVGMCGEGEGGEGGGGKGGVNLASAAPLPLKGWLGSTGAPLLQGEKVDVAGSRRRKKEKEKKSGSNRTKIPTYGEGANRAIGLPFKQMDQEYL